MGGLISAQVVSASRVSDHDVAQTAGRRRCDATCMPVRPRQHGRRGGLPGEVSE